MPGFLDPKAYIFDLDGTLIDSLGVWDKVDEILASEIARVDYSDLDLPRFREISLAQNSQKASPYEAFCGELESVSAQTFPRLKFTHGVTPSAAGFLRRRCG